MRDLTKFERKYVLKKVKDIKRLHGLNLFLIFTIGCISGFFCVVFYDYLPLRLRLESAVAFFGAFFAIYAFKVTRKVIACKKIVNGLQTQIIRGAPVTYYQDTRSDIAVQFFVDDRALIVPPGWTDVLHTDKELEFEVVGANGELGQYLSWPYAIVLGVRSDKGEISVSDKWYESLNFYSFQALPFLGMVGLCFLPIIGFALLLEQVDDISQLRYAYSQPVVLNNLDDAYSRIHNDTIKKHVYITRNLVGIDVESPPFEYDHENFHINHKELYPKEVLFKAFQSAFDDYFKHQISELDVTPEKKAEILQFILSNRSLADVFRLGLNRSPKELGARYTGERSVELRVLKLVVERDKFKNSTAYTKGMENLINKVELAKNSLGESSFVRLFIIENKYTKSDDVYQYRIIDGYGVFVPIDIEGINFYMNLFIGFLGGWISLFIAWRYLHIRDKKRYNIIKQQLNIG